MNLFSWVTDFCNQWFWSTALNISHLIMCYYIVMSPNIDRCQRLLDQCLTKLMSREDRFPWNCQYADEITFWEKVALPINYFAFLSSNSPVMFWAEWFFQQYYLLLWSEVVHCHQFALRWSTDKWYLSLCRWVFSQAVLNPVHFQPRFHMLSFSTNGAQCIKFNRHSCLLVIVCVQLVVHEILWSITTAKPLLGFFL